MFTSFSGVKGCNDMQMRKINRVFETAVITQRRKPVKIQNLKPKKIWAREPRPHLDKDK